MSWSLMVPHDAVVNIDWTPLRPRVTVRAAKWSGVYRPKVSGRVTLGPITARGRLLSFTR